MISSTIVLLGCILFCIAISTFSIIRIRRHDALTSQRFEGILRGDLPPEAILGKMISDTRRLADASRSTASGLSGKLEEVLGSITGIKIGSSSIAKAGILLTKEIEESASAAEELGASASSLADLAARQSAVVVQSSAAIEQMSASAAGIARVVADRKKANNELAIKSHESANTAMSISRVIDEFAKRAAQMAEMVHAIHDISERTNLLAMNAAIEAAHAGNAGRGFAVVADEIRKLANTAGEKASAIDALLKSIDDSISDARDAGNKGTQSFAEIDAIVGNTLASFDEIAAAITELSGGAAEIVTAVGHTKAATDEIEAGSRDIASAVISIRNGITATKTSATTTEDSIRTLDAGLVQLNLQLLDAIKLNADGGKSADAVIRTLSGIISHGPSDMIKFGELDTATVRLQHKQWVSKVLLHKSGALHLDPAVVADSHACDLGLWLYRDGGLAALEGRIDIDKLQKNHDRLHVLAAHMIKESKTTEGERERLMIEELESISGTIAACLSNLDGIAQD